MEGQSLSIRPATPADRDAVIRLAVRALGWSGDERDRAFFAWKHDENPFGRSPAWVAVQDGQVVGFRTFLRWELVRGDSRLKVVRAVDTASDPAHQGRGIFRRLTLGAVGELASAGYDAVFNTPNDQSRPGYLKMGWSELGRPTLGARPAGPVGTLRMIRSRRAADKWSQACDLGDPAADVLADPGLGALLAALPRVARWATPRTARHLRWRYGFAPLHYRAIEVRDGIAVFRVRRRGRAREVSVCEWLGNRPDRRSLGVLSRAGDYVVSVGLGLRHGMVPLPHQGPVVTWRPLARPEVPSLGSLAFSLGDLELM